ncbi:MAG: AmmeMemoRadiSam system radical SAM enzyme [Clostridiaceae bacterium]|nr:AmmeMemoRadiSam system radical SAM enzyme [Clostridiaceae bacterium]MBW4860129.1 AmmeMemoRadiSam system radical SAM enzyme [Clostridiaceae bacterium]MBW4869106.1 AmmeMemoRadiSam system radical SAM enzyme [Clostridiaceae bacterium]
MEKLKEALYYEKLRDRKVKCYLCPHGCIIEDGNLGFCKARQNKNGILYTLNYGKVSSYAYDPIEKKPLYHFYPGSKIFSIGTFGCNLECGFCQNWEIAHSNPVTVEISDGDILKLAKSNSSIGVSYTYNEPSIWYEYILNMSKKVKGKGLKNVYITNGYIEKEPLKRLLPYIDAMNVDLKSIDDDFYKGLCKGSLSPVLETIKLAEEKTLIEVTTLLIEGKNDSIEKIREISKWLSSIDKNIPLHLTRYHPAFKMDAPSTSYDSLLNAKDEAIKYLNYVYIGNVWGADANTYCPECNIKLVERNYNIEIIGIEDNKCTNCGYNIRLEY